LAAASRSFRGLNPAERPTAAMFATADCAITELRASLRFIPRKVRHGLVPCQNNLRKPREAFVPWIRAEQSNDRYEFGGGWQPRPKMKMPDNDA
jgi:hypothetical protein